VRENDVMNDIWRLHSCIRFPDNSLESATSVSHAGVYVKDRSSHEINVKWADDKRTYTVYSAVDESSGFGSKNWSEIWL